MAQSPPRRRTTLVHVASPFELEATASLSQEVSYAGEQRVIGGSPQGMAEATKLAGDGLSIKLAR
jgi:hypothetical protein